MPKAPYSVGRFKHKKGARPTPPVCKGSLQGPPWLGMVCPPPEIQATITIIGMINSAGNAINGSGSLTPLTGGPTIWQSTSVVLGLDVVAMLQKGNPNVSAVAGALSSAFPVVQNFTMPTKAVRNSCPYFHEGPYTIDLVPGPGQIIIEFSM